MAETDLIEARLAALKELHEQRFNAMDEALRIRAVELARRLESLNHAHEEAVAKEISFVGREAYDTFVSSSTIDRNGLHERLLAEVALLRKEIQDTTAVATQVRADAAAALAATAAELKEVYDRRFNANETRSARLTGGIIFAGVIVPLITALVVYLLTRHGVPVNTITTP